jgi:glucosamine--fructose-6-phosphate aminotransferase (isomerizing)
MVFSGLWNCECIHCFVVTHTFGSCSIVSSILWIEIKSSRINKDNMTLHTEIFEQPERLASLLDKQKQTVLEIAKAIQSRNVQYAFLAARGTSDNAGRYANYLWGAHNGLPLALATPSLFTYYQSPPRLQGALVIGISQSGQSPDIVSVLQEGRRQSCLTLAITNEPDSPLAKAADLVLDIQAGEEKAVARPRHTQPNLWQLP